MTTDARASDAVTFFASSAYLFIGAGISHPPMIACSFSETEQGDGGMEEDWRELENMLPANDKLLASARNHRAPQEWYEESIEGL